MDRQLRGQWFDVVVFVVGVGAALWSAASWVAEPTAVGAGRLVISLSVVLLAQFPLTLPSRAGEVVIGFEAAVLVYLSLVSPYDEATTLWLLAMVLAHGVVPRKSWTTRVFNIGCTTGSGLVLAACVAAGRGERPAVEASMVALGCAAYFVTDLAVTAVSLAVIERTGLREAWPGRKAVLPLVVFVGIDSLGYLAALIDRAYAAWAMLLLLVPLVTIVVAARAVAKTRDSERRTAGLFAIAQAAVRDDEHGDIVDLLVARLSDMLPQRDIEVRAEPPGGGEIGSQLNSEAQPDRWLVVLRGRGAAEFGDEERQTVVTLGAVAAESLERQRLVAEMTRMATFDPLTGLTNRPMFTARLAQAIERGRRLHQRVAVLYCDLDGFKGVNDRFGHLVGDRVLAAVGERLESTLRGADTAARLGGDEFAVLVEDLDDAAEAVAVGERIVRAFEEPIVLPDQQVRLGVSVGVAVARDDSGAESLLRCADMAMYRAKAFGKSRVEFFDPAMQQQSEHRMRLEDELRRALDEESLSLHVQPVVDLANGRIDGFEALLRWSHPTLGNVPPDVLLPVADEIGVMPRLGRWVLREAHRHAVELGSVAGRPVSIAVNVAAEQLRDEEFLAEVERVGADERLHLVLELTERALVEEATAAATLTRLHDAGVAIAIDDFGIGYSSIGYLHRFSCIDIVKIDRSFVLSVAADRRTRALVESIVAMAHAFDAVVVAEGIEDEAARAIVAGAGCALGQGFLFSPAVSLEEATGLLRRAAADAEPGVAVADVVRFPRRA